VSDVAVSVNEVWKNFRLYHERNRYIKAAVLRGRRARYEEFWALKDVSFTVPHGSTFGIIGSNGSGKSTLLKCLAGILTPNKGSVTVNGRLSALLELGAGFHPELSGRENVYLNGAILGMSKRDIERRYDAIVEFAGLERFIDTPVKNFSSGMTVRLGFAIAAHVEPEILLIDEVLSVGDQSFQRKSSEKIEEFRREGRTIIVVSHGTSQLQQLCRDVAWLEKGKLRAVGPANDVIAEYTGDSYDSHDTGDTTLGRRWGSGKVMIESVETLDSTGVRSEMFVTGSTMEIRCNITAHTLVQDMVVYMAISTLNGNEIWSTSTRSVGFAIPRIHGPHSFSLEIPRLTLLEGTYLLTVALRNRTETNEFDHWEHGHKFDVHQQNRFDAGVVALDSTWSDDSRR
jgi:ABC-2 type transport system ATP-binding protein